MFKQICKEDLSLFDVSRAKSVADNPASEHDHDGEKVCDDPDEADEPRVLLHLRPQTLEITIQVESGRAHFQVAAQDPHLCANCGPIGIILQYKLCSLSMLPPR